MCRSFYKKREKECEKEYRGACAYLWHGVFVLLTKSSFFDEVGRIFGWAWPQGVQQGRLVLFYVQQCSLESGGFVHVIVTCLSWPTQSVDVGD